MADNVLRFDFLARDQFSPTAAKVGKETDGLGTKIGKFGKFAATALAATGVAMGGMAVAGISLGVKTAASLEQAQIGFTTLLHSGTQAQAFLKNLTAFAAATPFELHGLIDSSRTLLGVGVNAKDTMQILTNFGDTASAVGIDQASFQRVMIATSQAIGAGKFQTADFNQIMNNGIPIWHIMSEATGKSTTELRKMASSGKLLSKDVLPELQAQMHKDYGGAMARQSETLNGLWSTFTDTLSLGLAKAITPMIPALKVGLAGASTVASAALAKLPVVLHDMTAGFEVARDYVESKFVPGITSAFNMVEKKLPKIDLSGLGKSFGTEAQAWSGTIVQGLTAGFKTDNWGPLGATLGTGLQTALSKGMSGGVDLADAVVKLFGQLDWFTMGEDVGKGAFSFVVGLNKTLLVGIYDGFKQHPLDSVLLVAALIPVGKFTAAFTPLRDLVEHLPLGEWFTALLDHSAVPVFDRFWSFVKFLGTALVKGFREVMPESDSWVMKLITGMGDTLRLHAMYMADRASELIEGIFRGIGREAGKMAFTIRQVIDWETRPFINSGKWLVGAGLDLISGLVRGLLRMDGVAASAVRTVVRWLEQPFRLSGTWLVSAGRSLLIGLRDGMFSAARGAASWAAQIGGDVVRAVKGYFGIHSPSTVFKGIGHNLMTSMFGAMISHNPVQMVGKIFGGMPQALGALVNKGIVHIEQLPAKAWSALGKVGGKVSGLLGSIFSGGGGGGADLAGLSPAERYIVMRESGGRTNAQNPTSTAFGLGQLILANRQRYAGMLGVSPNTTDFGAQLQMMRMYIRERYGNAQNAAAFEAAHHFYDQGGIAGGKGFFAKNTLKPERVLSASQTVSFDRLTRMLGTQSFGPMAQVSPRGGDACTVTNEFNFHAFVGSKSQAGALVNEMLAAAKARGVRLVTA